MQAATKSREKTKGNSSAGSVIIVIGLILIIAGSYFYLANTKKMAEPVALSEPAVEATPVIETVRTVPANTAPVEEAMAETAAILPLAAAPKVEPAVKLPSLDDSDSIALASAQQLSPQPQYAQLLISREMIRNFVVFVDNFSRGELVANFSPLKKPGEPFSIVEVEREMYLNTDSYNRYNIYADIIDSINIESAMRQYRILKPLFDEAYQEIGYPEERFHSRLSAAIELVLDTPVILEPIALVAPSAMYKFSDPKLEALPGAQKLIMRMGPDNILKLKAKLLQIQHALLTF